MRYPFGLSPEELERHIDEVIDVVWEGLQSNFLTLPRGPGFLTYERFAQAVDRLVSRTRRFSEWSPDTVWAPFQDDPLVLVVVRTVLGMTPSEWAYLTEQEGTMAVSQNRARVLDRKVRQPVVSLTDGDNVVARALLTTAVRILSRPVKGVSANVVHRLDKIDMREGLDSLRYVASSLGVPYPVLLYERFLGRPFASHRDSVSELVGDVMESAIEDVLTLEGVTYRKTKRAERVPGFEQAPDFIIPDELRPRTVIEAKMTEDDGTARDKVTRILYLCGLSRRRAAEGDSPFQVVACIDGRGFGVRREDMRTLLLATDGNVFTLATLKWLVKYTDIAEFRATD